MSPELITAVKERIDRGYTEEVIKEELRTAGHVEAVIAEVFDLINHGKNISETNVPSITDLFAEGWTFAFKRWELILALVLPLLFVATQEYFFVPASAMSTLGLVIFNLLALIWYFLAALASFYIISNNEKHVSLNEGITWSRQHVWKFAWLYLLMSVIVYGGLLLFLIPGIIVMVLTFFAPYVYIKEGRKGMEAILRSRELVKGRWFAVFVMLFKILLILIGMGILMGIAVGIISSLIDLTKVQEELIVAILSQFLATVLSLIGFYIGYKIYLWLVATKDDIEVKMEPSVKTKYILLALMGVILPVALLGILIAYSINGSQGIYSAEETEIESVDSVDYKEKLRDERNNIKDTPSFLPENSPNSTPAE